MLWGLGLEFSFYLPLTCVAPTGLGTGRKNQGHRKAHTQLLPTETTCLILVWSDSVCGYGYVGGMVNTQGGYQLYPGRLQNKVPLESSSLLSPAGLLPMHHALNPFSGLNIPMLGLGNPGALLRATGTATVSFSKDYGELRWGEDTFVFLPKSSLYHDLFKSCWPWPLQWDSHLQKSLDQKVASIFLLTKP